MTTFGSLLRNAKRAAPRIVELPVHAWADTWDRKPVVTVKVGIRLISESDVQTARAEAAKKAVELHEGHLDDAMIDAFNDALMRWVVARATCTPEDVTMPFFEMAEDEVADALTSAGVRRLYDEFDMLAALASPLVLEASDDDLKMLSEMLSRNGVSGLGRTEAARVRRLAGEILRTWTTVS